MNILHEVETARQAVGQGQLIAYPTESVYGLGCDPFCQSAVARLLALKQRQSSLGLILLIADWSQLERLITEVPAVCFDKVRLSWPGPVTWVFPKSSLIPACVSGQHDTIAIRMTAHSIAHALCADGPIISTSANISGQKPALDIASLYAQFPRGIDAVLEGALGGALQVSPIYDVISGQCLRSGAGLTP